MLGDAGASNKKKVFLVSGFSSAFRNRWFAAFNRLTEGSTMSLRWTICRPWVWQHHAVRFSTVCTTWSTYSAKATLTRWLPQLLLLGQTKHVPIQDMACWMALFTFHKTFQKKEIRANNMVAHISYLPFLNGMNMDRWQIKSRTEVTMRRAKNAWKSTWTCTSLTVLTVLTVLNQYY